MPCIVPLKIASCSSEAKGFPASNLLTSNGFAKWKSVIPNKEKESFVEFEFSEPIQFNQIDVGNEASAFVEILVKSSAESDKYEVLLSSSSFMSPSEAKQNKNINRVRMFCADDFNAKTVQGKWDTVRVVCSQPFNSDLSYGLAFVKFFSGQLQESNKNDQGKEDTVVASAVAAPAAGTSRPSTSENNKPMTPTGGTSAVITNDPASSTTMPAAAEKGAVPSLKRRVSATPSSSSSSSTPPTASSASGAAGTDSSSQTFFKEIMKGVVFVLSGYQNPQRGAIRSKAVAMGATYSNDWDDKCTHLICAFKGTPKFEAVKGKGCIVSEKWILDSHEKKQLQAWRKYRVGSAPSPTTGTTTKRDKKKPQPVVDTTTKVSKKKGYLDSSGDSSGEESADGDRKKKPLHGRKRKIDSDDEDEEWQPSKEDSNDPELVDSDMGEEEESASSESNASAESVELEEKPTAPKKTKQDIPKKIEKHEAAPAVKASKPPPKKAEPVKKPLKKIAKKKDDDDDDEDDWSSLRRKGPNAESTQKKANKISPTETPAAASTSTVVAAATTVPAPTNDTVVPPLPNFLSGKCFALFGDQITANEKRLLKRIIIGCGGHLEKSIKNKKVTIVITKEAWKEEFNTMLKNTPFVKFIHPDWLFMCDKKCAFADWKPFLTKRSSHRATS